MSGHSKWSTIKRKKGAADAKRGKLFTKLIREIATAASLGGGEVDSNPRLRLAIDKARGANMPKDNIERAIKKGTGEGDGGRFEEVTYEGYGPAGVAILVRALTDNRNRTVGEIRHTFSKFGGNLGEAGCVAFLFEQRGVINLEGETDFDRIFEVALEAGAEDVIEGDGAGVEIVTTPEAFEAVRGAAREAGFEPALAEVTMRPSTTVRVEGSDAETMIRLAEALEDLDDIQDVYANFDIPEAEMERLTAD